MESQLGKPPILPITAKLLITNGFSFFYIQGWYYTLFTNNYWKEAMTPWFIICYPTLFTNYHWKEATTP